MNVRQASIAIGIVFLVVAIIGFLTTGTTMEASMEHAPRLLGLFPVNLLHNLVHLLFGIWGLVGSRSEGGARTFLRAGGVIYILLAVVALVSPTGFGVVPIGSHDIWLHALLGIVMAVLGFSGRPSPQRA